MATDVSSVTRHFPSAQNGFTTTTSGSVSSGATTVGLNSVAGYSNGEVAVFVIDPTDATKKQTFTGVIDTAGVQVTNVVWTAGTNQTHALGATVVDYATATHISMVTKGLLRDHNQSGYHKTLNDDNGNEWIKQSSTASAVNEITVANAATGSGPVISATGGDTNIDLTLTPKGTGAIKITKQLDGWVSGLPTPNTVTYNGNRSYDLVFNSTDLTTYVSPGTRLKLTRTVTAPTGAISLNGTTQYASKSSPAGFSFTDDFTISAWIKLNAYPTTRAAIVSKYNNTSGFVFDVSNTGQLRLLGYSGSSSNVSYVQSYQSIPLNKWVHVAAQLDMSTFTATTTTSYTMIDGVDVPASVARGGTNPTSLTQAGNLNIGTFNDGSSADWFNGQIAQVAIYSAKVTQATIKASSTQTLTGSETSLVSAYKLDQASGLTDLSANANNLTATGSPSYATDTPFTQTLTGVTAGTTNYAIVQKASFSTNTTLTVQVPESETIPTSGGVSAVSYSQMKTPYGFPAQERKWIIETIVKQNLSLAVGVLNTNYDSNIRLNIPVGDWAVSLNLGYSYFVSSSTGTGNPNEGFFFVANTSSATDTIPRLYMRGATSNSGATTGAVITGSQNDTLSLASATSYSIWYNEVTYTGGTASAAIRGDGAISSVCAKTAYL